MFNSEIDRAKVVKDEPIPLKDIFSMYESGKDRRYTLLFAVNGGAYAIATWLLKDGKQVSGTSLRPLEIGIAVGLIVFTVIMCMDIYEFGKKMRNLGYPLRLFRDGGQWVLGGLAALLILGWAALGWFACTSLKV
jgi:hypothetical protein